MDAREGKALTEHSDPREGPSKGMKEFEVDTKTKTSKTLI